MSRRTTMSKLAVTALAPLVLLLFGGCPLLNDLLGIGNANANTNANTSANENTNTSANENTNSSTGNSGLTGKYVGSERCSLCHVTKHSTWSDTLHAKALDNLEAAGQGTNAECVGCHTTGYGETGGWVDRATTADLAGVGCEACHGPALDHVSNIEDATKRPVIDISAAVCGACHTGAHQPNYDDWLTSGHAMVTEDVASSFTAGRSLNSCGTCHSGDFFVKSRINGETVADTALQGVAREDMNGVTCAVCHDPHKKTGNAFDPEEGRDYQLRFPEVATPTPVNSIDAATDPTRFNICGQCHHSRGRTWEDTSRSPHHSLQANVYTGEMPLPDDDDTPIVLSRVSVHSFAPEQCATCHMYRQPFQSDQNPTISGHTFQVNENSCATAGCHPSSAQAEQVKETLQAEIQARLDDVLTRLGAASTWEYTAGGGPNAAGQAAISENIKKIRFLYYYAANDGSLGIHNPAYVRDMLIKADQLLTAEGK